MNGLPLHYMLDADGEPVAVEDVLEWSRWWQTANRIVAQDKDEAPGASDDVMVSTVFLGLDHNFNATGPPVLWETLVFGGPLDGEMWRWTSRTDALVGHQEVCRLVAASRHA